MCSLKEEAYEILLNYSPRIKLGIDELKDKKILVIAPHPDDETLGCGGTIARLTAMGAKVKIVLCTDDALEVEGKSVRLEEFQLAINQLGHSQVFYMGEKDGTLKVNSERIESKLSHLISKEEIDWIFIPYILDVNEDHKAVANSIGKCLKGVKKINVAMYEVWTPILYPNLYIDITDTYTSKEKAVKCYKTQEIIYGIKEKVEGLDHLRTNLLMKKGYRHVEAFKFFPSEIFVKLVAVLT